MDNESESKPILAKSLGLVHSATKEFAPNQIAAVEEGMIGQKSFVEKTEVEDRHIECRSESKHELEGSPSQPNFHDVLMRSN